MIRLLSYFVVIVLGGVRCDCNGGENVGYIDKDAVRSDEWNSTQILSRRKRFLIFPEGSSLQLVFCLQASALIPIGDIFLFGSTVALAWELPTDPKFLYMFKQYKNVDAKRRGDLNHIYYLDADGKIAAKVPYKRRTFFNPAFAKRSVKDPKAILSFKNRNIVIDRKRMHDQQLGRGFLKTEHMDESSISFHRSSRIGLYEKLEALFKAFGWDGRQCVLRKLCESGRQDVQRPFLQELMRIIFVLPKTEASNAEDREEYDMAHGADAACDNLYPNCPEIDIVNNIRYTFDDNMNSK